jgi:Ca2+-binding EF-hand superfamily protein
MFRKGEDIDDFEFKTLDINPLIKKAIIYDAFDVFDKNKDGVVDFEEFKKLLKSLDETIDDKKILELMKAVDKDLNQEINIDEFYDMMIRDQFSNNLIISKHLQNIFEFYDRDGDGYISSKDIEDAGMEYDDKTQLLNTDDISLLLKFAKLFASESELREHDKEGMSKDEFLNLLLRIDFLHEVKKEHVIKAEMNVEQNENKSMNSKSLKNNSGKNTIISKSEENDDKLYINK